MQWTLKELQENLANNIDEYGSMVSIAALYKKLYGVYPKIGLSGQQAEFVDSLFVVLPDIIIIKEK